MLTLRYSNHNHPTIMSSLHPLLELQAEILVRVEPTTTNSGLHMHPDEVMVFKSTTTLDLEYRKRKSVPITGNDLELHKDSKHLSTG